MVDRLDGALRAMVEQGYPDSLGEFIRRRRMLLGISQAELARSIQRPSSQVARWEKDRRHGWVPSPDVVEALSETLDVEPVTMLLAAWGVPPIGVEVTRVPTAGHELLPQMLVWIDQSDLPVRLKTILSQCVSLVSELHREVDSPTRSSGR